MKKHLLLLVGLIISAVCLYFALRGIPMRSVAYQLKQADARWIAAALFLYIFGYLGRIWRWKILMMPIKQIPVEQLAAPLMIGFFANLVLPFRMGEFIRAHISGRKFSISRTASLGTIFIERIFDTLSFLSTFLCASLFYPFPAFIERGAWMLGAVCMVAIAVLWIITTHRARFEAWVHWFGLPQAWALRIEKWVNNFAHGISGLRHIRSNLEAALLSLVIWFIEGMFLWLIARAFHLAVPVAGAFFLLFFIGLAVTLPQAPGYVGTMELFGVMALGILKIPKDQGLSMILAVHALQFMFIGAFGLWGLHHEGLTLTRLMTSQEKE